MCKHVNSPYRTIPAVYMQVHSRAEQSGAEDLLES